MFNRPRHPKKEIEYAIQFAESLGWRYIPSGGSAHSWGRLLCSWAKREGCMLSIWSTPRCSESHAKQIIRKVKQCEHTGEKNETIHSFSI